MSRFVSKKLKTIDLWDWEFIKIPTALSYAQVMKITDTKTEIETSKLMLTECIKEWNLKDEDWNIPEVNEENIMQLNIKTITKISEEITKLLINNQDKKK